MLTRAGVARRLRKSIATVRRMEGAELHPEVDDAGVHWFHVEEVDAALARRRGEQDCCERAPRVRAHVEEKLHLEGSAAAEPSVEVEHQTPAQEEFANAIAEARAWAKEARAEVLATRRELERLGTELERQALAEARARDMHELALARESLLDEIAGCDARTLRRLSRREIAELITQLENDAERIL
jgi:hypothetical protein